MVNKLKRWQIAAYVIYVAVAIFTFGHAGSRSHQEYIEQKANCPPTTICVASDMSGIVAIGAAAFWPFYWSQWAQS